MPAHVEAALVHGSLGVLDGCLAPKLMEASRLEDGPESPCRPMSRLLGWLPALLAISECRILVSSSQVLHEQINVCPCGSRPSPSATYWSLQVDCEGLIKLMEEKGQGVEQYSPREVGSDR